MARSPLEREKARRLVSELHASPSNRSGLRFQFLVTLHLPVCSLPRQSPPEKAREATESHLTAS